MKLKLLTLLLAATALTAACDDDDDNTGPEGEARIRAVHASPDAPEVDVLLDDAEVLSDVPYLAASGYLETSAGDHNLKVNAAGTTTTVIDADATLADGTDYTVIASGLVAGDRADRPGGRQLRAGGRQCQGPRDSRRAQRPCGRCIRDRARGGPGRGHAGAHQRGVRRRGPVPRGAGGGLPGPGDAGRDQDRGDRQRRTHAGERTGPYCDCGGCSGRWRAVRPAGPRGPQLTRRT